MLSRFAYAGFAPATILSETVRFGRLNMFKSVLVSAPQAATLWQDNAGRLFLEVNGRPALGARMICETLSGEALPIFEDDRSYLRPIKNELCADERGGFPPAFAPPRDMVLRFQDATGADVLTLRDSAERAAEVFGELMSREAT